MTIYSASVLHIEDVRGNMDAQVIVTLVKGSKWNTSFAAASSRFPQWLLRTENDPAATPCGPAHRCIKPSMTWTARSFHRSTSCTSGPNRAP